MLDEEVVQEDSTLKRATEERDEAVPQVAEMETIVATYKTGMTAFVNGKAVKLEEGYNPSQPLSSFLRDIPLFDKLDLNCFPSCPLGYHF